MTSREPQPHAHAHHHEHGHAHGHAHDLGHGHAHDPAPAAPHAPGLSLIRMSAAQRVSGAAALAALLWLGVFWALT